MGSSKGKRVELPMHAENIEAAKREVLRLLGQTRKVLKDITNVPDLLRESDTKRLRQLDIKKALEWQDILKGEIQKGRRSRSRLCCLWER